MYSNCCCSCSFESEIIKISQPSLKMYSNKILNFQVSTTILNASTKKSGNLLKAPRTCIETSPHDIITNGQIKGQRGTRRVSKPGNERGSPKRGQSKSFDALAVAPSC